jgi:hypothetical protein
MCEHDREVAAICCENLLRELPYRLVIGVSNRRIDQGFDCWVIRQ